MEAAVGGQLGQDVAALDRLHEVAGRKLDPLEPGSVEARQRQARRSALEQRTQAVDLLEVCDLELGDEVAAPGEVGDLSLLLEDAKRLAHRRDADAELLPANSSCPIRAPGRSSPATIARRRASSACWVVVLGPVAVMPAASAEGLVAGERAADDQRVHVGGALVGDDGLEVVHVPDHRVLERDAVGAEDLTRGARDVQRSVDVGELAHAHVLRRQTPRVLHAPQVQREQRCRG